jgi:sugar phosphate isomerase/epimerase
MLKFSLNIITKGIMPMLTNSPDKWMLGVSTSSLNVINSSSLMECRKSGIQYVELSLYGGGLDPAASEGRKTLAARAKMIKDSGLVLWSGHLPFCEKWNISGLNSSDRKETIDNFKKLIELSAEAGISKVVVHPSSEPINPSDRSICLKLCRESLLELNEKAKNVGLQIAVEDLPRTCLGNSSSELSILIDGIEGLGICCDMNHMLQETTEDFISMLGSQIVTTHISDYDRINERHWLPGKGVNNWPQIMSKLAQAGYTGPFVYEVALKQDSGLVTPFDIAENRKMLLQKYNSL